MRKVTLILAIVSLAVLAFQLPNYNRIDDRKGVEEAILDYVEGLYLVDTNRIHQSVHSELRKRGYWFSEKKENYSGHLDMSFQELVDLSGKWNASGKRANENSIKKIDIFDIQDKTASAKLTAEWGTDYFHLVKLDGKWMIMNVLWQSPPK